jgi:hypothetical protein
MRSRLYEALSALEVSAELFAELFEARRALRAGRALMRVGDWVSSAGDPSNTMS